MHVLLALDLGDLNQIQRILTPIKFVLVSRNSEQSRAYLVPRRPRIRLPWATYFGIIHLKDAVLIDFHAQLFGTTDFDVR